MRYKIYSIEYRIYLSDDQFVDCDVNKLTM